MNFWGCEIWNANQCKHYLVLYIAHLEKGSDRTAALINGIHYYYYLHIIISAIAVVGIPL